MSRFNIEGVSINNAMTNRPIVTLGIATITLVSTIIVDAICSRIDKKNKEPEQLVIDENFIEQMRAGTIDVAQLGEQFKDHITVDNNLVEKIKTGKIIFTEQDIKQLAPVMQIQFEPAPQQPVVIPQQQVQQIGQPIQQPMMQQPVIMNPVVQPVPNQQAYPGQVAPVQA